MRLSLPAILIAGIVLLPLPSAARSTPVAACQSTIRKTGAALVDKVLAAERGCLEKVAKGKLPGTTVCLGAGGGIGDITESKTLEKLNDALAKARVAVGKSCSGIDLVAPPPSGIGFPTSCPALNGSCEQTVTGSGAVLDCLECAHLAAAHYLLDLQNAAPPLCGAGTSVLTFTNQNGSDLDVGWSGLNHNLRGLAQTVWDVSVDCTSGVCIGDGAAIGDRTPFGGPLPASAAGVAICVVTELRQPITGARACGTGCTTLDVHARWLVFLAQDTAKPCPACVGDPWPHDGQKGGTCEGGKAPGAACDVDGVSEFGSTSVDCLPTGSSVGELDIDLSPLTTGTVTVTASVDCLSGTAPGEVATARVRLGPTPATTVSVRGVGSVSKDPSTATIFAHALGPASPEPGSAAPCRGP